MARGHHEHLPQKIGVFGEYIALLEYNLARREELYRQIEALALTPQLASRAARTRDVHQRGARLPRM